MRSESEKLGQPLQNNNIFTVAWYREFIYLHTMAQTPHSCSANACTYETPEDAVTFADKLAAMTLHTQQAHPQPAAQGQAQPQ